MAAQLSAVMARLIHLHRQLLAVADRKREVVISGEIDPLQSLLKEEAGLIDQVQDAEEERLQAMARYVSDAEDVRQVTLSGLVERMAPREREKIREQMEELTALVRQLKRTNEQNETLVDQSLQYVRHTLNVLTQPADDYVYHPQAHKPQEQMGSGVFDRKA